MTTYIQVAENLTGESLNEEEETLRELITELQEAMSTIDPDLLNHDIQIISASEFSSSEQR